jgi:hypothetical protein
MSSNLTSQAENLAAAVALHVAHYRFVRIHSSIKVTPAIATGVMNDLWMKTCTTRLWPEPPRESPYPGGFFMRGR